MSVVQRLIASMAPRAWARSMEQESRAWKVRCGQCSFERSVWEWGGIRWKAAGKPRRRLTCPQCGKTGWHTVHRP